ncbi:MAG: neutral/alkaline non-lysosomal ceramidase N-terminal domain-containing protein [Terriglobia bacterium]
MSKLWAGWSKREFTIPIGHRMAGYVAREKPSTGRLGPLFVRALVLKQGRLTAGIIVADLLLISNRWAERLRSRLARVLDTRREHIIVAATHTHSGPQVDTRPFDFASGREDRSVERSLMRSIEQRMERVLAEAKQSIERVKVAAAHVPIRGVATDRNHPNRGKTQRLFLVRFQGKLNCAVLGVYGCHSTVLGPDNTLLSGDLHAEIARSLEKSVNVVLMTTGAAANISTRFTRSAQTSRELCTLAAEVTRQAAMARFRPLRGARLAMRAQTTRLRVSNLESVPPSKIRKTGRLGVVGTEARLIRERLARAPEFASGSIMAPLTVLRIGTIDLAALPFEIYSDTGEFLWKRTRLIPICYANGYWGYVPSPAAGPEDYETISSPFVRDADAKLRRTLISLMKRPTR